MIDQSLEKINRMSLQEIEKKNPYPKCLDRFMIARTLRSANNFATSSYLPIQIYSRTDAQPSCCGNSIVIVFSSTEILKAA